MDIVAFYWYYKICISVTQCLHFLSYNHKKWKNNPNIWINLYKTHKNKFTWEINWLSQLCLFSCTKWQTCNVCYFDVKYVIFLCLMSNATNMRTKVIFLNSVFCYFTVNTILPFIFWYICKNKELFYTNLHKPRNKHESLQKFWLLPVDVYIF